MPPAMTASSMNGTVGRPGTIAKIPSSVAAMNIVRGERVSCHPIVGPIAGFDEP